MTLSPQPPSLFPFVPISYPFRPLLRRLHMILFALKSPYSFCWLSLGCVPRPGSGLKSLSSWWVKITEESFPRWDLGFFDEPWSAQVILKRNSWSGRTLYKIDPVYTGSRVNSVTAWIIERLDWKLMSRGLIPYRRLVVWCSKMALNGSIIVEICDETMAKMWRKPVEM